MRLDRIFGLTVAGVLGSLVSQSAFGQNLLANPGFETGDFSGWTLSGSFGWEGVSSTFASLPNSGRYSAYFGATEGFNIISQTINTTPGDTYNISFALDNSGGPYAEMWVNWGGTQVIDLVPTSTFGWGLFGITEVAGAGTTTTISFGFEQVPSYFNFDDARVIDLTALDNPDVNGIVNTDFPDTPLETVPDQPVSLWTSASLLAALCAAAARRRSQTA